MTAPRALPEDNTPSPLTKAIRARTYRDWFGDRWTDVQGVGCALMLTIRFVVWVFDLDDGTGSTDWRKSSPSATKLAGLGMVLVGLATIREKADTTAALNTLVIAGVSALFGRSMWKGFLARSLFSSSATASAATSYSRQVIDAHYTVDGIPATSNPPVPGAKTLAGDD